MIEQLLNDLLSDTTSPEFRAALLDQTLREARQRQRARRFKMVLSAAALAGVFAFTLLEMPLPTKAPNQIRKKDLSMVNSQKSNALQFVTTKPDTIETIASTDHFSTLVVVRTTESARPKEIDDKQLLSLLSEQQVALVYQGPHRAELISFNSEGENIFPVQSHEVSP